VHVRGVVRNGSGRWTALAAGGALALAGLTGCAGPTGGDPGAPGGGGDQGEDVGTVTVTFSSGEHAGSYEGSGSLKCSHGAFVPDGWWIVFASSAEEESPEVVNIINFWQAPDAEVDNPDSPYPGETGLLNVWLGNPYIDGAKFDVGVDAGGSVAVDGADGNTVTFSGTTAAGESFSIVAACPRVTTD
jgi:hypothetical protein